MINRKLTIEAVSVCINYADFLEEAVQYNLPHLDQWTIVTTPDDSHTHRVCKKYDLRCVKTECMYLDTAKPRFNKARAINYGLAHLALNQWVLHLDADTVLPPQFKRMLENKTLHDNFVYGMDRVDCNGAEGWDRHRANPLQYDWSCLIYPPPMKVGARIAHGDYGGYCPIGYFQLWNPKGSGIDRYPVKIDGDMEHTDVLHAIQWPDDRRVLLPEGYCVHLVSTNKFGANWKGRTSPPFRPAPAPVGAAANPS